MVGSVAESMAGPMNEPDHERIRDACLNVPIVDAHAHNVVALDSNLPFLQCLSEARGHESLSAVPLSLSFQVLPGLQQLIFPHKEASRIQGSLTKKSYKSFRNFGNMYGIHYPERSLQELGEMYGVEPNVAAIQEHRDSIGLEAISEKCFSDANIKIVLLDEGLTMDKMLGLGWHRKYIPRVHRVLRIETVAEAVLNQPVGQGGYATWTLESFDHKFVSTLESFTLSEKVVAFKSIAAYRSGLRINPLVSAQDAENGLHTNLLEHESGPIRVTNKHLIDFMFVRALEVATEKDIPMQIHTGILSLRTSLYKQTCEHRICTQCWELVTATQLKVMTVTRFGDKDLQLELANPLHLRAVLEDPVFANSRIVLLHGSYPFMREASYLASVYPQVHIDFGLVVPKLSVRGMRCAVSDLLDLAPMNKIMYSSDGYAFPETFYLAAKWSRDILALVLCESYNNGDLTLEEALAAAELILCRNAMEFYKLQGTPAFTSLSRSGSTESMIKLQEFLNPAVVQFDKPSSFPFKVPAAVHRDDVVGQTNAEIAKDIHLEEQTKLNGDVEGKTHDIPVKLLAVKHVRLLWSDASGQRRCRVIPVERFEEVVVEHGVGLAQVAMGMSSHSDGPAPNSGLSAVGEIRLMPDLSTKLRLPWCPEHEMVLVDMHEKPGMPWKYCPRSTLKRLSQTLRMEFNLVVRAGFESGFYLLKQADGSKKWVCLDETSYSSSKGIHAASSVLSEIYDTLSSFNINVEEMHGVGGGQFEMSIAETHCLTAADNLLLLKEAVAAVASKHSLRASFVPKYSGHHFGEGSRVRLSLWQDNNNVLVAKEGSVGKYGLSQVGAEFLGGVFHHLPAILAFTAPTPISYDFSQSTTAGEAYHYWGQTNLQAPLRCASLPGTTPEVVSSFEMKPFDGCANPHLGLAAILSAGIDGLRKHIQLPEPIDVNIAEVDKETVRRLPSCLEEAVEALKSNTVLRDVLGAPLVTAIAAVRTADCKFYKGREDIEELLADRY